MKTPYARGRRYDGPGFEEDACFVTRSRVTWLAGKLVEAAGFPAKSRFASGVSARIREIKSQKWCRKARR